jgi:hypothetical protein
MDIRLKDLAKYAGIAIVITAFSYNMLDSGRGEYKLRIDSSDLISADILSGQCTRQGRRGEFCSVQYSYDGGDGLRYSGEAYLGRDLYDTITNSPPDLRKISIFRSRQNPAASRAQHDLGMRATQSDGELLMMSAMVGMILGVPGLLLLRLAERLAK